MSPDADDTPTADDRIWLPKPDLPRSLEAVGMTYGPDVWKK